MATTILQDGCFSGALAGFMSGRSFSSFTATDYSGIVAAADAVAQEFLTENTASGAAMADADNAQIGFLISAVALSQCSGRNSLSITQADYITIAKAIYAATKQGLTKMV